jgi:NodT family efflux transporter outer membrane factor (OMF) lipoprotein
MLIRSLCHRYVRVAVPALAAVALVGCTGLGTTPYERPDAATPEQFSNAAASARAAIVPHWWKGFQDEYLNSLIERSIEGNLDLRISVARVEEAGAAIGQAQAARLPRLTASGNVTRSGQRNPFTDQFESDSDYGADTRLAWELDIWGKLKKGVNARRAAYRAGEADWRAAYLATVSQVASAYFLVRQLDEQMVIQRRALRTAQTILDIFRQQHSEGLVANTQVLRQEAELTSIRRGLLDLQRQRDVGELALATLLGVPAADLDVPEALLTERVQELEIPAGLPADLLRRRPDIVAAEYRVLEAHELVGQAQLARLPSISLTGNTRGGGSLASASLSSFIKSFTFGIGPSVDLPIFDPSVQTRIRSSKASARTREEEYRKTVLLAFEEVERALINISSRRAQKAELEREVANLRMVARQTQQQLKVGLVSQLEVLESERRLLTSNQSLLDIHQRLLADTVTLYKAMGGGWDDVSVSTEAL